MGAGGIWGNGLLSGAAVRTAAAFATALPAVALASFPISCAESTDPLLGEWVSVESTRPSMTYIFEEGGRSRWVLDLPQGVDTFAVDYRADYDTTPIHLDVGPWSTGPVAGQTLFGIVEMLGPDRFRVDFEPGDPESGGTDRPNEFSQQTVTFVRTQK